MVETVPRCSTHGGLRQGQLHWRINTAASEANDIWAVQSLLIPPRFVPRHADPCQCAIGSKCLRKSRGASIADLLAVEIELCRPEKSKAGVWGKWTSRPMPMRASVYAVTHAKYRHNRHVSACDWLVAPLQAPKHQRRRYECC